MATVKRTGVRQFEATFDESVLINDGGILLIDLKITKWNSTDLTSGFMYSVYQFKFTLDFRVMNKMKTKLLLGIPVFMTLECKYMVW